MSAMLNIESLSLVGRVVDGDGETDTEPSSAEQVVREWHREVHIGSFDCCEQQPCHAIARL